MILFMNKLSKIISIACVAVLLFAFALLISGCRDKKPETPTQPPVETEIPEETNYTLDPNSSYAIAGVEEVIWNEEDATEDPTETPTEAPTEESTEAPTETPTEAPEVEIPENPQETAYESYMNMSPEQQEAFMESFGSVDAFIEWLKEAKSESENSEDNSIIIDGNGPIDMEDIFG